MAAPSWRRDNCHCCCHLRRGTTADLSTDPEDGLVSFLPPPHPRAPSMAGQGSSPWQQLGCRSASTSYVTAAHMSTLSMTGVDLMLGLTHAPYYHSATSLASVRSDLAPHSGKLSTSRSCQWTNLVTVVSTAPSHWWRQCSCAGSFAVRCDRGFSCVCVRSLDRCSALYILASCSSTACPFGGCEHA